MLLGYVLALAGVGLAFYLRVGEIWRSGNLFYITAGEGRYASVFVTFYAAGTIAGRVLGGSRVALYDPDLLRQTVTQLVGGQPLSAYDQVYYPPYTFLVFYLLTGLDLFNSWLAVVPAAVVVNVLLATALARRRLSYRASLFVALAVVFNYVTCTDWRMGNVTALLLLPLQVVFWEALRGRRFFAAGALAAVSTLKPQYSLFLLVPALLVGGWRGLIGFAGCLVGLGSVSVAAFGVGNCLDFPAALLSAEHVAASGVQVYSMQNLRGLLCCLAGHDASWVRALSIAAQLAALLGLVYLWLRGRREHEPSTSFDRTLAITVLSSLLFSLHTHFNDYIVAAVVCISLWNLAGSRHGCGALLLRVLILSLPGLTWAYFALVRLQVPCQQLLFAWAVCVLAAACCYRAEGALSDVGK
jgi:hypothetical protein